jgi:general secretion pathway protein B
VPKFSYNGHNYSTDSRKRSVILDGKLIKEGKSYKGIDIVEIKQNYVIMRYNGQSFSQRAMEDN